jgi:hypothetical protein
MSREADSTVGGEIGATAPPGPPPPPPPPDGWGAGSWGGGPGWAPPGWGQPPRWSPPSEPRSGPGPRQAGGGRRPLLVAAAIVGLMVIAGASGTATALLVRGSGAPASAPPSQPPSPTPGPATVQARAVFQQMLAAANASAGCHYVAVSSLAGASITHETITGDAGQKEGTQAITLSSTYGNEQFSLRLTSDGSVYFQGNTPALEDQIGVVASDAASLDGRWIRVSAGDGPYQQLEAGITVASHLQGDTLVPASVVTLHTASGTVLRISGTGDQGVPAHFDAASGSKLPQAYAEGSVSAGLSATESFSNWGSGPSVSAPSGAVAWSSLPTQRPPGGYGSGGGTSSGTPGSSPTPTPSPGSA